MNFFVTMLLCEIMYIERVRVRTPTLTTTHTDFNENTVDTIITSGKKKKENVKMFSHEMFLSLTKSVCVLLFLGYSFCCIWRLIIVFKQTFCGIYFVVASCQKEERVYTGVFDKSKGKMKISCIFYYYEHLLWYRW